MHSQNQSDIWGNTFSFSVQPFGGKSFWKTGFIFSGQGSSFPGMFKNEILNNPLLVSRFKIADQLSRTNKLSFTVSDYIFNPINIAPADEALCSCLALVTLQMGLFEVLLFNGVKPDLISSHSFGEYAGLTASGVISFEDAFRILIWRHDSYIDVDGCMLALSASALTTESLISDFTSISIANINSPMQTVVSGSSTEIQQLKMNLKKNKVASILLPVNKPYHSQLLAGAAKKFKEKLVSEKINFFRPTVSFHSSTLNRLSSNDMESLQWQSIICDQLVRPIDFVSQINLIYQNDIHRFIEIGPQKTLSPLIQEIIPITSSQTTDVKELGLVNSIARTQLPGLKPSIQGKPESRILGLINKVFANVTGYQIADISLQNRIQEDLGIDSIKKAEIVFSVMQELSKEQSQPRQAINLSEFSTVEDLLTYFHRQQRLKQKKNRISHLKEELFTDYAWAWKVEPIFWLQNTVLDRILISVEKIIANPILEFNKLKEFALTRRHSEYEFGVVFDAYPSETIFSANSDINFYKPLLQFFKNLSCNQNDLGQLTRMRAVFNSNDETALALFYPFLKSLSLEMDISFQMLGVESLQTDLIHQRLDHESGNQAQPLIKYDQNVRWCRELQPIHQNQFRTSFTPKKILVLGGLGGIGQKVCESFIHKNVTVVISGRKPSHSAEVQQVLNQLSLRTKESTSELASFHYEQLDLNSEDSIMVIGQIEKRHGPLDLVLNCAGKDLTGLFKNKSDEHIEEEFLIKYKTFNLLIDYFSKRIHPVRILHFASIIGEFGNAGAAVYALANSYLSTMSQRNYRPGLQVQSISWPGWKELGMIDTSLGKTIAELSGFSLMPLAVGILHVHDRMTSWASGSTVYFSQQSYWIHKYNQIHKSYFKPLFATNPHQSPLIDVEGLHLRAFPGLIDHKVLNVPILSCSFESAIFLFLGLVYFGRWPRLKKLRAENFMPISDLQSDFFIEKHELAADQFLVELRSSLLHATAEISNDSFNNSIYDFADTQFSIEVRKSTVTAMTDSSVQTEKDFWIHSNLYLTANKKVLVSALNTQLLKKDQMPVDFYQVGQLLEALIQAGAIHLMIQNLTVYVPQAIDELIVHDLTDIQRQIKDGTLYCQSCVSETQPDLTDLFLLGSDCKIFFEIRGFRTTAISNKKIAAADHKFSSVLPPKKYLIAKLKPTI